MFIYFTPDVVHCFINSFVIYIMVIEENITDTISYPKTAFHFFRL